MSLFDTYPGKFTPPLVLPSLSLSALINWSNKAGGVVALHLQEMDIESFYGTFFNFSGLFEDTNKNFWYLAVTTEVFAPAGVWLPKDAYAVDVKIDDGLPRDGKMRSISGRFGTGMWDPSGTACVDKSVTPYQYNIQQIDISAATLYEYPVCAVYHDLVLKVQRRRFFINSDKNIIKFTLLDFSCCHNSIIQMLSNPWYILY